MFHHNQQKLREQNASRYHLEMSDIRYIPIQNMIEDGILKGRGSMETRDKDGQRIRVINRSRVVLQKILSQANWTDIVMKVYLSKDVDDSCGFSTTHSYTIKT